MNQKKVSHTGTELKGWSKILVYAFFAMFAITMVSVPILFVRQPLVQPVEEPGETLDALLLEEGVKDRVAISVWRFSERDLTHNIYQNFPADVEMTTAYPMGRTQELLVALVVGALVDCEQRLQYDEEKVHPCRQLEGREQLQYEDKVGKWLPDAPAVVADVTLEALLTHTAGFPAGATSLAEIQALEQQDASKVDTYAPLHYQTLVAVVEAATGKSIVAWVDELIAKPLELQQTAFRGDAEPVGFYTSMQDMGVLLQALNSNQMVRMKTLVRAFSPIKVANGRSLYGHGWEIGPFYGLRMMRIDDAAVANTAFARFSLYGLMIAIHTDLPPEQLHAGVLSERIARIYLEREMPQFGKPPQGEHEGLAAPPSLLIEQ